jgi:hypothetical protein
MILIDSFKISELLLADAVKALNTYKIIIPCG